MSNSIEISRHTCKTGMDRSLTVLWSVLVSVVLLCFSIASNEDAYVYQEVPLVEGFDVEIWSDSEFYESLVPKQIGEYIAYEIGGLAQALEDELKRILKVVPAIAKLKGKVLIRIKDEPLKAYQPHAHHAGTNTDILNLYEPKSSVVFVGFQKARQCLTNEKDLTLFHELTNLPMRIII
ncbi:MAG: hypothetical protein OXH84_00940 [Gammaproteobacteria bacterium]|nr:hypothetical protein [Gammaproteobacteria bacterium]